MHEDPGDLEKLWRLLAEHASVQKLRFRVPNQPFVLRCSQCTFQVYYRNPPEEDWEGPRASGVPELWLLRCNSNGLGSHVPPLPSLPKSGVAFGFVGVDPAALPPGV